ncbi:MAG: hypothetical protein AB8H47_18610 [Bacteroidia bacterium]
MNTRTNSRVWLVGLCLLYTISLDAQDQEWKVSSFGIHLQYNTPTEPQVDSAFFQAHLINPRQLDIGNNGIGIVPRRAFEMKSRFQSGVNLSLEKQLKDNTSAQLRLNLNYSSPHGPTLQFRESSTARISQQGLGLNIDYRGVWKKGAVSISAGIGVGGKLYINPNITFISQFDTIGVDTFNFPGGQGQAFRRLIVQVDQDNRLRPRVDFNVYLPFGVAIRLTRRIQLEFDARLSAGAQHIKQIGTFKRPLGGSFQLAYVFLL